MWLGSLLNVSDAWFFRGLLKKRKKNSLLPQAENTI
jgi:hypothetical protein